MQPQACCRWRHGFFGLALQDGFDLCIRLFEAATTLYTEALCFGYSSTGLLQAVFISRVLRKKL